MKVKVKYRETREHEAILTIPDGMEESVEIFATDAIINGTIASIGESRPIDFKIDIEVLEDDV